MSKTQNPGNGTEGLGHKRRQRGDAVAMGYTTNAGNKANGVGSKANNAGNKASAGGPRSAPGRTGSQRPLSAKAPGSSPVRTNVNRQNGVATTIDEAAASPVRTNVNRQNGQTAPHGARPADKARPSSPQGHASTKPIKRGTPQPNRVYARHVAKHAAPRRRRYNALTFILVVLFIAAIGAGGFFCYKFLYNPYEGAQVEDGKEVTVVIPEGSSGSDIINILLDAGVIHSSKDFRKAAQEQNADQSLRSGTYSFVTGSDPSAIVKQLVVGPNSSENQLKLPEGFTLKQTADAVESSLGINHDDFIQQAKASNYVDDYAFLSDVGKGSLEGYLYPKTYDFAGKDVSADSVIRLMLEQYKAEVATLDMNAAEKKLSDRYNLNVTDYDILKIASIIEKEALNEDDRAKISSVFYNRLEKGMALESDATMGYVTGGGVTEKDLKTDSAYNTYLHKGLPPTPICTPSLWAIQAAMEPADTDYFFFFIIDDGVYSNHTFSKTYEEHDSAYKEALAAQKAANADGKKEN